MSVTHEGIEVAFGTDNDKESIENAWETNMHDQMKSLNAQKISTNATQHEQRKVSRYQLYVPRGKK